MKSWQLEAEQVKIRNSNWESRLNEMMAKIQVDLGCKGVEIESQLYKMLIYEKGGFFAPHRDTEKVDRMFATLVVMLPSIYEGGQLIVRHKKETKTFDFSAENVTNVNYVAFYCDCEHEIQPITSGLFVWRRKNQTFFDRVFMLVSFLGYRICLVYNLAYKGEMRPNPVDQSQNIQKIGSLFEKWLSHPETPKMAIMLDHSYTKRNISFDSLKGSDRALIESLKQTKRLYPHFDFMLGLITKHDSGWEGKRSDEKKICKKIQNIFYSNYFFVFFF